MLFSFWNKMFYLVFFTLTWTSKTKIDWLWCMCNGSTSAKKFTFALLFALILANADIAPNLVNHCRDYCFYYQKFWKKVDAVSLKVLIDNILMFRIKGTLSWNNCFTSINHRVHITFTFFNQLLNCRNSWTIYYFHESAAVSRLI